MYCKTYFFKNIAINIYFHLKRLNNFLKQSGLKANMNKTEVNCDIQNELQCPRPLENNEGLRTAQRIETHPALETENACYTCNSLLILFLLKGFVKNIEYHPTLPLIQTIH